MEACVFSFEKLEIWQDARKLAAEVYRIVESFPSKERFALAQQLQRAVVSIAANIAEGSSRASQKDFSRFVEIAFGSLCEVIAELSIAKDLGYIGEADYSLVYAEAESLGRRLSRFRASLERSWIKTRPLVDLDHQTIHHQTIKQERNTE